MRGKPWTETEVSILRENYVKTSMPTLMGLLPGRTWTAIRGKAAEFNLNRLRDYHGMTRTKWVPEEDQFLRNNRGKIGLQEMAIKLEKSVRAIEHRLHILGLSVSKRLEPQPEKLSQPQLAYLAGLIDADGGIWFTLHKRGYAEICIGIGMKDGAPIRTAHRWLVEAGFHPTLDIHNLYQVNLRRHNECLALLRVMTPFLIGKQEKAKQVMAFCASRLSHPHKEYNERELAIINKVQANQLRGRKWLRKMAS